MRRVVVVAAAGLAVAAVWWLAEDANLRDQLADLARGDPPPGWGDVAGKVGEFASEERGLKDAVGTVGSSPAPAE